MDRENSSKTKSRSLSIFEFFEILQLEYLTAKIRCRIYPSDYDKEYYKRVMDGKKKKIEDIATRNLLPSIFNDNNTKEDLYKRLYGSGGTPQFMYRNEEDRNKRAHLDLQHYYSVGAEVKVSTEDGYVVGEIYKVHLEKGVIFIKLRGEEQNTPHSIQNVTRII